MKRSRVNEIIRQTEKLLSDNGYVLPPFLNWTPEEWQEKGHECDEIRDNALGWDVTDFGTGDFDHIGLTAVTLRNGNQKDPARYPKPYAEKYLVAREGQHTPMHFHTYKMEDIINRGGGILELKKGQSVTYTQRLYHEFWGKEGCGDVLIGEVSMCNDDDTDNHFLSVPGRFPAIEEDEAPYRLLCKEYPHA